jgi:glucose/arabinose dehydrogenase
VSQRDYLIKKQDKDPDMHCIAILFATIGMLAFGPARADTLQSSAGPIAVQAVVTWLDMPWGLAFVPGGGVLVTEKAGTLRYVRDGRALSVRGGPRVTEIGQGGLLDVMVPGDFAASRQVYLSYATGGMNGAVTALGVGQLSEQGDRLDGFRQIFAMASGSGGGRHFGSRIVEGRDGKIYLTTGDRGDDDSAQALGSHNGKVIRLNRDGSVPADNPFVGQAGAQPEIWSYGHRNPQGAALDAEGRLWTVEHGARGGDEVNRIEKGTNFGWPVISYGRHYSGGTIGIGTARTGMAQPAHYWDPSIAPSGLMIYSGKLWPEWRGDLFTGSLKFGLISRVDGTSLQEAERIEGAQTERLRDIREAPDGAIWILSEGNGALYRLTPG